MSSPLPLFPKITFHQHFVDAITGFQEKTLSGRVVTDINLGGHTLRVDGDVRAVLTQIFPCTLKKTVPLTRLETGKLHLRGEIKTDHSIRHFRDPIGW